MVIKITILIFLSLKLCAQDIQQTILDTSQIKDSLVTSCIETSEGFEIEIVNSKKDTCYLFSTYLSSKFFASKYLHRIDLHNGYYKICFTPIIPLLYSKRSDLIKFDSKDWVLGNQNLYSFEGLPANSKTIIKIRYADLFKDIDKYTENAVSDFDPKSITTIDDIAALSTKDITKRKFKVQLELAIYDKVNLLITESAYYLKENEFLKQAKSFKKIIIPVKLRYYSHRLF